MGKKAQRGQKQKGKFARNYVKSVGENNRNSKAQLVKVKPSSPLARHFSTFAQVLLVAGIIDGLIKGANAHEGVDVLFNNGPSSNNDRSRVSDQSFSNGTDASATCPSNYNSHASTTSPINDFVCDSRVLDGPNATKRPGNRKHRGRNAAKKNAPATSAPSVVCGIRIEELPEVAERKEILRAQSDRYTERQLEALEKDIPNLIQMIQEVMVDIPFDPILLERICAADIPIYVDTKRSWIYCNEWFSTKGVTSTKHAGVIAGITIFAQGDMLQHKAHVQSTLCNELNHAALIATNRNKISGTLDAQASSMLPLPFLNENGEIDLALQEKLSVAIELFEHRIEEFASTLMAKQQGEMRFFSHIVDRNIYQRLSKVIGDLYEPVIHRFKFASELDELRTVLDKIENKSGGKLKISEESLPNESLSDAWLEAIFGGGFADFSYAKDDSSSSKCLAFVNDWKYVHDHYVNPDFGTHYYHDGEVKKLAEYSSHLEELPKEVLQILAPEWLEYFREYHGLPRSETTDVVDFSKG